MKIFSDIITNKCIYVPLILWFFVQAFKVITELIKNKKLNIKRIVGAGGMPSSHSAVVTSLATMVGINEGLQSPIFGISAIFAFVVMYDAAGVRRSAGQQAKILNRIVEEWGRGDFTHTETKLRELLGHTPVEVFAGALLGIIIAIIRR